MRLKIRCDGECEKFYKIIWKLNKVIALLRTCTTLQTKECGTTNRGPQGPGAKRSHRLPA